MVSRLEIKQFCESMRCAYAEVSVVKNTGIDELVDLIILKSIDLEEKLKTHDSSSSDRQSYDFARSDSTSFGIRAGSISMQDIQPLNLKQPKKKGGCCSN
jgi:hypothetical protein